MMLCPEHKISLLSRKTQYGIRYACPIDSCTVVAWDGSTSTPANFETRQARFVAHGYFDKIWRTGKLKRKEAYKKLSEYLGISAKDTHIGYFDIEMCGKVVDFAEAIEEIQ